MVNESKKTRKLAGAGLLAAFAASLCCITPLLAVVAGMGGIASSLSWLEPFRPFFIGLTVLVLGFAWYQQLKSKKEIECDCETDEKKSFLQTKMFLGIVTVLAALLVAFPYYSSVFYPTSSANAAVVSAANVQQVDLKIKGMTCTGCETKINQAVSKVSGVIKVKSNYKTGEAVVQFDKSKASVAEIVNAVNSSGYEVVDKDSTN
ncbi:MAG: mercuric transport protein MerTP [Calditrichaeota bacterium]|nr:mercuric transport protein MerTP [Calditrichota bacterium]